MYLQPLMDQPFVEELFGKIKVDDNNIEELIDIGLGQGAAPRTGYRLLIESKRTCNAITFFDSQLAFVQENLRSDLAEILVQHLLRELHVSLLDCVAEQTGTATEKIEGDLELLVNEHRWAFENCGHHLDVSHLAATVRIARFCRNAEALSAGRQLAIYGCALDEQLKFKGETPFEILYEAHLHYFNARLSNECQSSVEYFQNIAQSTGETAAAETLIEIYQATGQSGLAIECAIGLAENSEAGTGRELISLAITNSDFQRIKDHFAQAGDLAAHCIAAIAQRDQLETGDPKK